MEPNLEEALRAKAFAEKHFSERDFTGARNYALKAQMLFPELDGISQMVATFGVYIASEVRINGELDLYAILGLDPSADKGKVKKQYKKMAVLLHPDKNTSVGADGAFKLVSEAWTILSDHVKRNLYDQRRNLSISHTSGIYSFDDYSRSSVSHHRLDTFWTVCTSCHVQYEYLRKYVNKKLSCKNCRGVFIAVETGAAPPNGSYPYSTWSYVPENGYGSHGVTYTPTTSVYCTSNGVSGHHSGHCPEYASNVTIQWNSFPGSTGGVLGPNGFSTSTVMTHQVDENANRVKASGRHHTKRTAIDMVPNGYNEPPSSRPGRPPKKMKVETAGACHIGNEEASARSTAELRSANANGHLKANSKLCSPTENNTRRNSAIPTFDARRMLIDKARTEIRKKVKEMRIALAAAEAEKKRKALAEAEKSVEAPKKVHPDGTTHPELRRSVSMSITVPDSDFHDFDKDRSEECFKPKQIWALYDEEDGMPRLYCLIREVISVKPFKIHISYLSSKTDTEFGSVNWLDSGFTKSCGNFRAFNNEIVEQVNIFSHLLSREKAGRGGCVRIYPRSGDIWAVYRNWSPDWNRTTLDEVRHQYEMVEVLGDYSEDHGVCVSPLVKVDGYKTVYRRILGKADFRYIPRREMLRFSHQVPSCLLKGEAFNLPGDCWDLDPAATPDELLQGATEFRSETKSNEAVAINSAATLDDRFVPQNNACEEAKLAREDMSTLSPDNRAQDASELLVEKHCQAENSTKSPVELPLPKTDILA